MRCREFFTLLSGAAVAWPLAGGAPQRSKLYRLGYLSTVRMPNLIDALRTWLRELGYFEGKNLKVEHRFGGPQSERLDASLLSSLPTRLSPRPRLLLSPRSERPRRYRSSN
jgi:putative tryptophan/tyrosine transport system substrate-binding protein